MIGSKLFDALKTLSQEEFIQFINYIESPFFNTNEKLVLLIKLLKPYFPSLDHASLSKEEVFKELYPGLEYDDRKVRWEMTYLLDLLYGYFAFIQNEKDKTQIQLNLLEQLRSRELNAEFEKIYTKTIAELSKKNIRNYDNLFYKHHFSLEQIADNYALSHKTTKGLPLENTHIKNQLLYLDKLYLLSKFKLSCKIITRNYQFTKPIADFSIQESCTLYEKNRELYKDDLILTLYYNMLKTLLQEDKTYLNETKRIYFTNTIPNKEKRGIFFHLQNFIMFHLYKKISPDYLKNLIDIYEYSFAEKFLDKDLNRYPEIVFNYVTCCILNNEKERAEKFVTLTIKHDNDSLTSIYNLSLAMLNIAKKEVTKATKILYKIPCKTFTEHVLVKSFLLKAFYENNSIEDYYHAERAFRIYLKRHIEYAKEQRIDFYLHFLSCINALVELKNQFVELPKKEARKKALELKEKFERSKEKTDPWIFEKLNEMMI